MADKSSIEWTDATWNPIVGCSIKSPGCANCYAMPMAKRIEAMGGAPHYRDLTTTVKGNAVFTGKVALAPDHILTQPLRWKRGRRIFVNSMGDLFHENVPDEWIDKVFAVMALCPQHTFQVLTKRAEQMRAYMESAKARVIRNGDTHVSLSTAKSYRSSTVVGGKKAWPLPNVWLGVSTERQQEADERIPHLLATPAAVRFISAEPLLGPIRLDLLNRQPDDYDRKMPGFATVEKFYTDVLKGADGIQWKDGYAERSDGGWDAKIDWVIVGGESGSGARPMHPEWARSLRDQCAAAGVPFFFKQWGEWLPISFRDLASEEIESEELAGKIGGFSDRPMHRVGKKAAGRMLDGKEHKEIPVARSEASPS